MPKFRVPYPPEFRRLLRMVPPPAFDACHCGRGAAAPEQFQQRLADAQAGRVDMVLAESLDWLTRDQEHIACFHKEM